MDSKTAPRVNCRSCGRDIRLRREPNVGTRLTCPGCGTNLEVIGLSPLEVDWAFEEPIAETASELLADGAEAESGRAEETLKPDRR
jgi:lysine biosynthesis protein LysW